MTERLPFHFSLLCIGEGNGNPLQCSCLEDPRDGVAQGWGRTVSDTTEVTQHQQQLFYTQEFLALSKEQAVCIPSLRKTLF